MNFLDKIIVQYYERVPKRIFFINRFFINVIHKRYEQLYIQRSKTKELSELYWSRKGGFEHAKRQLAKDQVQWKDRYNDFFLMVKEQLLKGSKILEIGCSAGQWAERLDLANANCKYLGVDINPDSIELAKQNFAEVNNLQFKCCNIYDIDCLDDYNFILSCQTLFFVNIDCVRLFLSKVKKGSIVIIFEPINKNALKKNFSQAIMNTRKNRVGISHNYIRAFNDEGYDILSVKVYPVVDNLSSILILAKKNN